VLIPIRGILGNCYTFIRKTSKNPFFSFKIKSAKAGDKVSISWQDNLAYSDTQEHIIS
jgi:hypothetical protein